MKISLHGGNLCIRLGIDLLSNMCHFIGFLLRGRKQLRIREGEEFISYHNALLHGTVIFFPCFVEWNSLDLICNGSPTQGTKKSAYDPPHDGSDRPAKSADKCARFHARKSSSANGCGVSDNILRCSHALGMPFGQKFNFSKAADCNRDVREVQVRAGMVQDIDGIACLMCHISVGKGVIHNHKIVTPCQHFGVEAV